MKTCLKIFVALMFATGVGIVSTMQAAAPSWEQVSTRPQRSEMPDPDKPDVYVRDGYIYISTVRPVTVKLMSIVGQLIAQQNVPAGVSRMRIASRGIYILKAGSLTTRVTI